MNSLKNAVGIPVLKGGEDVNLPAELEPLAQWDERYQQTQNVAQAWNQLPVHTALNTMAFAHHPSCHA